MNWWRNLLDLHARHQILMGAKHADKIAKQYPSCPAGDVALMVARINEDQAREH